MNNRLLFWYYLIIYDVFVNNICTIGASSSDNVPQRRRLSEISSHRGYGTHYVTLSIGSPPQSMRLAISTGSDYTSLPCKGCSSCSNPKFQFLDEKIHNCPADCLYPKSKCQDGDDAENPRCHLSVSLSDMNAQIGGGFKGFEVTDSAYIEMSSEHLNQSPEVVKKEPFPLHFLCLEDITGEPSLSDGFLSMSNYPLSFINQFVDNKKIKERLFSLCFRDFDEYEPEDSSAGHVTFGRMDRNLLDSPLVWARNVGSPELQTSYAVHIRKIYFGVGGSPNHLRAASMGTMSIKPIEVSSNDRNMIATGYFSMSGESGAVMIQTNQPISFLHKSIEESFKSAFFSITGIDYTVPAFPMTERQFKDLPTLFIQFEAHRSIQGQVDSTGPIPGIVGKLDPKNPYDVLIAIQPKHYVIFVDGMAFPSLRFSKLPRISSNLLQNHEIVFDLDHNRIGFAERKHCPEGATVVGSFLSSSKSIFAMLPRLSTDKRSGKTSTDKSDITDSVSDSGVSFIETKKHASKSGAGNGLNEELDYSSTFATARMADGRGRISSGREKDSSIESHQHGINVEKSYEVIPVKKKPVAEKNDGLPKPDASLGPQTPRIGPGGIASAQHLAASRDIKQENAYNWWDVIGFSLFATAFSLTLYLTQDRIVHNEARMTRSRGLREESNRKRSLMDNDSMKHLKAKLIGDQSVDSTKHSTQLSDATTSSVRPYYDRYDAPLRKDDNTRFSNDSSFQGTSYNGDSTTEGDTTSSYHDEKTSRLHKLQAAGSIRFEEQSVASFFSESADSSSNNIRHYQSNMHKIIKPVNQKDRKALMSREGSLASKSFFSQSFSSRSGVSIGDERPNYDDYVRYEDEDDFDVNSIISYSRKKPYSANRFVKPSRNRTSNARTLNSKAASTKQNDPNHDDDAASYYDSASNYSKAVEGYSLYDESVVGDDETFFGDDVSYQESKAVSSSANSQSTNPASVRSREQPSNMFNLYDESVRFHDTDDDTYFGESIVGSDNPTNYSESGSSYGVVKLQGQKLKQGIDNDDYSDVESFYNELESPVPTTLYNQQ